MSKVSDENRKIVKRLLGLLKPFKREIAVVIVLMAVSAGVAVVTPFLSRELMDKGLIMKDMNMIVMISAAVLALGVAEQALEALRGIYQNKINVLFSSSLERTAFRHTLKLKPQYFNHTNTTELMSVIQSDVSTVSMIADQSMFYIALQLFRFIGGLAGLVLFIDLRLAVLSLIEIPIRYVMLKYLTMRRRRIFESYIQNAREQSGFYGDTIGGIKEIKLYGLERIKMGEFTRKQRQVMKSQFSMNRIDIINMVSEITLSHVMSFLVYVVGGLLITQNSLSVGSLFAFFTYSVFITGPVSSVLGIGYRFSSILPSAKRLFEFLDMETEDGDTKHKKREIHEVQGDLRFESVSFAYTAKKEVLKNISFEISRGERVAIVGKNGAGKSSVIRLLLQMEQQNSGSIFIDDIDIKDYKMSEYRKLFSVVSQDVYLFDSTIRNNITLGLPVKDELIRKAAKDSSAYRFIKAMPDKYDTKVGTNGANLSGGERQKVAIARALVRKSPILILDEANSNFDVDSEYEMTKILQDQYKERTIIVISHRTSLLRMMDKIIMLENGTVEAVGKHDDLYRFHLQYRKMIDQNEQEQPTCDGINHAF